VKGTGLRVLCLAHDHLPGWRLFALRSSLGGVSSCPSPLQRGIPQSHSGIHPNQPDALGIGSGEPASGWGESLVRGWTASAKRATENLMLVDNPILNSPFEEPTRCWIYKEGQLVLREGRRPAGYRLKVRTPHGSACLVGGRVCPAGSGQHRPEWPRYGGNRAIRASRPLPDSSGRETLMETFRKVSVMGSARAPAVRRSGRSVARGSRRCGSDVVESIACARVVPVVHREAYRGLHR